MSTGVGKAHNTSARQCARPARPGVRGSFALLRERAFRWLWISNAAFFLGVSSQIITRSILVFELRGDAGSLSLVTLCVGLPMLFFSPLGGALADRLERRGVVITAQSLMVVSESALLLLYLNDLLAFWHLLLAAGVAGSVFPFSMPARQALTVTVVGHRRILQAMSFNMGAMSLSRVVGPLLIGSLVSQISLAGALAFGVGLHILSVLGMTRTQRSQPPLETPPLLRDMHMGLRYLRAEPRITALLLYGLLPLMIILPLQNFLIIFARDVWGGVPLPSHTGSPDLGFGLLLAMVGLGGLASALWLAALGETRRRAGPMLLSLLGLGAALIAFSFAPWFWLALPLLLFAGVLNSAFETLNRSTTHSLTDDRVRGRVTSFMLMSAGLTPLGALPLGWAIDAFGAPAAVSGAGALLMLCGAALAFASRSLRTLDEALAEKQRAAAA